MQTHWSKPSLIRDFSLLAVFIVLVLALVSMWVTFETYQDNSERIFHQLETEATRIDRAMILEINHSAYLIESLGRQISHMDKHELNNIALLLRSFDTTATAHHVFSWIDDTNANVVSSNQGVHKPIDVSDRDFLQKAIQEPGKVQIGSPMQGRVSAKWVLPVAMGLTDNTGKYLGTILISMDIATITRNLHAAVKESGILFSIYSSKSILPLTQMMKDDNSSVLPPYIETLKTINLAKYPSGILSRGGLFNTSQNYVYYETSVSYPYIILMELNNQVSINSIKELLLPRLIQIFLMGLFMLTLLWVVKIRILKPISELSNITADLVAGKPYGNMHYTSAKEVHQLEQQIRKCSDFIREMRWIDDEKENKNALLRRLKDELEFTNQIHAEFLTAMSHEFRVPLNTVIGFSEMMKNQPPTPDAIQKYHSISKDIHDAATQLKLLLDDVITLNNTTGKEQVTADKNLDIRVMLYNCVQDISQQINEKIHIEFRNLENFPHLVIDEKNFRQIIINILGYIIVHNQDEKTIIVEANIEPNIHNGRTFVLSFIYSSRPRPRAIVKTGFTNLGIFLARVLAAMSQGTLDVVSPYGKTNTIILRFPDERIAQ